jgi:hypothetical protein
MRLQPFATCFIVCFSIEGILRSVEVLEVLRRAALGLEIDVALVGQPLVKFLLI